MQKDPFGVPDYFENCYSRRLIAKMSDIRPANAGIEPGPRDPASFRPVEINSQVGAEKNVPSTNPNESLVRYKPLRADGTTTPSLFTVSSQSIGEPVGIIEPFQRDHSTYIPNFTSFLDKISKMEEALRLNFYYERTPGKTLSEKEVMIYYCVALIYRIAKGECANGRASTDKINFIEFMERNFDMKNLIIEGPLAESFVALNPSAASNPKFRNVLPVLPSLDDHYDEMSWDDDYLCLMPNIPLMIRAVNRLKNGAMQLGQPVGAQAQGNAVLRRVSSEYNLTTDNIHGANNAPLPQVLPGNAANRLTRFLRLTPGFSSKAYDPSDATFYANMISGFPNTPNEILTWLDFCGFEDEDPSWFDRLITKMDLRASFTNGPAVLDELMTNNSGQSKISLILDPQDRLWTRYCDLMKQFRGQDDDDDDIQPLGPPPERRRRYNLRGSLGAADLNEALQEINDAREALDEDVRGPTIEERAEFARTTLCDELLPLNTMKHSTMKAEVREENTPLSVVASQLSTRWNAPHPFFLLEGENGVEDNLVGNFWDLKVLEVSAEFRNNPNFGTVLSNFYNRNRSSKDKL
jgi:hypothetical protein